MNSLTAKNMLLRRPKLSHSLSCSLIVLKKRWRGAFWIGIRLDEWDCPIVRACVCVCVLITSSILFSCVTYIYIFFFSNEKGRVDDNIETIRKRFKVFLESSMPVIEYYGSKGKVRKVMHFFFFLKWGR